MSYSRVKIAARLRPAIPGELHDKVRTESGDAIYVDNPRDPSQTFKYPCALLGLPCTLLAAHAVALLL